MFHTLLATLLFCSPALAQSSDTDDRAKELYSNGRLLYDEGRYEEAIKAWNEAYKLSDRHPLLLNIANAYERLGDLNTALDTLATYKIYAPEEKRESLNRRIRMIESRLEEKEADEAAQKAEDAAQKAEDAAEKPDPAITTAATANPPPDEPVHTKSPALGLGLMGAGIAGFATGGVFGVLSTNARGSLDQGCHETGGRLLCPSTLSSELGLHRTGALVADIGFIVGALATTTGVIMLASGKHTETTIRVGPQSIGFQTRF